MGLAWFQAEQWALLRSLAADPEVLGRTHGEWEAIAEKCRQELERMGLTVRKIVLDVDDLVKWCAARQRPLDAAARAQCASDKLREAPSPPP